MIDNLLYRLYCMLHFKYGKHLAIIACPENEPLHFHHDGCPACEYYEDMEELAEKEKGKKVNLIEMPYDIILDLANTLEEEAYQYDYKCKYWLSKVYGDSYGIKPRTLLYNYLTIEKCDCEICREHKCHVCYVNHDADNSVVVGWKEQKGLSFVVCKNHYEEDYKPMYTDSYYLRASHRYDLAKEKVLALEFNA